MIINFENFKKFSNLNINVKITKDLIYDIINYFFTKLFFI